MKAIILAGGLEDSGWINGGCFPLQQKVQEYFHDLFALFESAAHTHLFEEQQLMSLHYKGFGNRWSP